MIGASIPENAAASHKHAAARKNRRKLLVRRFFRYIDRDAPLPISHANPQGAGVPLRVQHIDGLC
jgi:hypothetical protein